MNVVSLEILSPGRLPTSVGGNPPNKTLSLNDKCDIGKNAMLEAGRSPGLYTY